MKKRYIELLEFLQKSNDDYVSGSKLANLFNVTTRTIRNDIKEINKKDLTGVTIIGNTRNGYKLVGNVANLYQNQDEFEGRSFQIIKMLLSHNSFVTFDELAQKLFFSTQTIRKDIQRIFRNIQIEKRSIEVEAIIFQGIRLKGNEVNKRLLLESLVSTSSLNRMSLQEAIQYYFGDWMDKKDIHNIITVIEFEVSKYNLLLNSKELFSICKNIIISIKRISMGQILTDENMILDHKQFEELDLAKGIVKQINEITNVDFNNVEEQFLSYLLISLQIFPKTYESEEAIYSDEIEEEVKVIINRIASQYGIPLHNHEKLVYRLIMHITKSLYPLKYYFPIENPFISQIKSEYLTAYNIAVVLAKELQGKLKVNIPENEIGYLALHIMSIIENNKETRNRVAIVYEKNQLVGKLLERKINLFFPQIMVDGLFARNEIQLISQDIETVITTVHKLKAYPNHVKNILQVSEMITDEDVKSISMQLNRKLLNHYLDPNDLYFLDEQEQDSLLKKLTEIGNIEYLYESILDRENMSSTSIGNLVAMPHPFEGGNNDNLRVLVAINKRKVVWGDNLAQIIFLFIPSKSQKVNNSNFFSNIYSVLKYSNITDRLVKVSSYEEFIEVLNSN